MTRTPRAAPARLSAAALIELMRLASPALPVGGFSYSEALEAAVEHGLVAGEAQAGAWLADQLQLSLLRSDLPVVALAFKAWRRRDLARVAELNDWVVRTRETRELAQQSLQMGRSLVDWMRRRNGPPAAVDDGAALQPGPCWPVAFALAAAHSGAPLREAVLAFAVGWIESMVAAAIRTVPLGQTAGQRLLDELNAALPAAVDRALLLPDSERQAFAPMLAILSARHETQYSRLFRS
jgi:urease accessory protein